MEIDSLKKKLGKKSIHRKLDKLIAGQSSIDKKLDLIEQLVKVNGGKLDDHKIIIDKNTLTLGDVADFVRRQPECAAQVNAALAKMAADLKAEFVVTNSDIDKAAKAAH